MYQVFQPVMGSALLLVDVINDLEFPGGDHLLRYAQPMAERTAALKQRARESDVPTIYINGQSDRGQPGFSQQVQHCLHADVRGRPIVELLRPEEEDYFILQSQLSVCLLSNLDVLLERLCVRTLVLTGMAAEICALFGANDAYWSSYRFVVPRDCVASKTPEGTANALGRLGLVLNAEICSSADLLFDPVGS
jgi:nicotinamidase-related amidase